jgi:uncharacterized repeat protein (TIGR03803 family)
MAGDCASRRTVDVFASPCITAGEVERMKIARVIVGLASIALGCPTVHSQQLTVLHNFTNSQSSVPLGRLVLTGGTLYGTAAHGGSNDQGLVYAVNTDGTSFAVLHDFSSDTNGGVPEGGLLLSGDTLYGTTALGGTNGPWGTVFSLGTNGSNFAVLHSFTADPQIGQHPHPRLMLSGSTLYGVASGQASPGWGSLFSIQTDGSGFDSLYTFTTPMRLPEPPVFTNSDGEQPNGALIPAGGVLYGTAYGGGPSGYGTVFSVTPDGNNFTVLHAFINSPDGAYVRGGLVLADGALYGTTWLGGSDNQGTVYSIHTDGTGYQVLHNFLTNGVDGISPWSGLTLWNHTLYGTTERGGTNAHGTIFSINTNGLAYTVFHTFVLPSGNFTNAEGTEPTGDLMISGHTLYGTTQRGGSAGFGTVFRVALPRPGITNFNLVGNSLTLSATNGVPGEIYTLLASSDIRLRMALWTPIDSSIAGPDGNLAFAATDYGASTAARRFYILQLQ